MTRKDPVQVTPLPRLCPSASSGFCYTLHCGALQLRDCASYNRERGLETCRGAGRKSSFPCFSINIGFRNCFLSYFCQWHRMGRCESKKEAAIEVTCTSCFILPSSLQSEGQSKPRVKKQEKQLHQVKKKIAIEPSCP